MQEQIVKRLELWKSLPRKEIPPNEIKITIKRHHTSVEVIAGTTPWDIVKNFSVYYIACKVNGVPWDLFRPLEKDSELELFDFDSEYGKEVFWHSCAHVLGSALEQKYGAHLVTGPPTSDGFYYDFDSDLPVSEDDYQELQTLIYKMIHENKFFERLEVSKADALIMFEYNKYKLDIINKIPDNEIITLYKCGSFIDLCRGPHIPSTGRIKAFKVIRNSSTVNGLTRICGIAFPKEKLMVEWQQFQDEAAKRDHRLIGKAQQLFFFHPWSPGSCFFLPHGTRIYNRLIEFIRTEYWKRGFTEICTPNIYDHELWYTSGHLPLYEKNMFSFEIEKKKFAMKPMNCPGHCLMFAHQARSYRELPIRFADFGVLHRNEISGALTGLTRVRKFQQDDAHIFCTTDQIAGEIDQALDFMSYVYGIFGFDFNLELSTRPGEFIGSVDMWNQAEKALETALNKFGKPWKMNPGDGAFYGPKIDIHILDALKRSHQCATIQLDFNLPERFKLEYNTDEDKLKRPVIIHRAILGSAERMIANLIEHTAGKWPFWLSPRQVLVVPVNNEVIEYAQEVTDKINAAGFYVDLDSSDRTFGRKMFEARSNQFHNFVLVVGKQEAESGTVSVKTRDHQQHGVMLVGDAIEYFKELQSSKCKDK
ncbi:Threonyl-tRNA synthetase [uncultured virus]|nr:Threonyl-tRNA synthetase [uncultured virus]